MSQPPISAQAVPEAPARAVSKTALAVVAILSFLIIGLIYLFVFVYSGMNEIDKYWWSGLVGFIFALIFYLVHASIREDPVTRILSGMFFVLGAAFFYAAVGLGTADPGQKILWLIVLSVIVLVVLLFVWRMSMQRAADEERKARRHRT